MRAMEKVTPLPEMEGAIALHDLRFQNVTYSQRA